MTNGVFIQECCFALIIYKGDRYAMERYIKLKEWIRKYQYLVEAYGSDMEWIDKTA